MHKGVLFLLLAEFCFASAPLFWKQKIKALAVLYLMLTMTGMYLVIRPDFSAINPGDFLGLLSGIVAAFAVIILHPVVVQDLLFKIPQQLNRYPSQSFRIKISKSSRTGFPFFSPSS
jgi:drug/metabolite transporter (DMT)-like permease